MHLEILSHYPTVSPKAVPLLFVHGSFAGAAVWDEYFLPFCARHGYAAHAVSLRGHGGSAGHDGLPWWSLADYVADLQRAVAGLHRPPVLIGHSMGGMVVQKLIESQWVPGAVLMASVPPQGLLPSLWGMAVSHPHLLQQLALMQCLGPQCATLNLMRETLFSDDTPDEWLLDYFRLLQGESLRVGLDLLGWDPLRLPRDHGVPMLVIGGGRDTFFSAGLSRDIARHYDAEYELFPDLAHALMLETGWQPVADRLLTWLDGRFA
jgi:pimeloyl-ACP methyl ester carboxylesterase